MPKKTHKFKKILVVDDSSLVCHGMKIMLTHLGYQVETAENGLDALVALKAGEFDLIFSDINMPVMDGCEMAKLIRISKWSSQDVPIIGISGCKNQAEIQKAIQAGMNWVYEKPMESVLLKKVMASLTQFSFAR